MSDEGLEARSWGQGSGKEEGSGRREMTSNDYKYLSHTHAQFRQKRHVRHAVEIVRANEQKI